MKRSVVPLLTFLASLILIFPGILSGKILHNCVYKYHFEPWSHHKSLIGSGLENPIISDSIDGADANLSPRQVSLFTVASQLQVHKLVTRALMTTFSGPTALSLVYWLTFALCFFSLFNFLRAWGVMPSIALALAIGFTYDATNNHYYAYGTLTAFGVACFWFLERLIQTQKAMWCVLLTLALINLGGAEMVHVVAFYSFTLLAYAIFRILILQDARGRVAILVAFSFASSVLMSADYLYSTAFHYLFNFEKGYREEYGMSQNSPISLSTIFFSRIFGDPILEQRRWPGGTFLTTSLFMGSLAAFALTTAIIPRRWPSQISGGLMFFVGAALIAALYQFSFPYERLEHLLAYLPPFKWVPPLYFKAVFHFLLIVVSAFSLTSILEGGFQAKWQRWAAICLSLLCVCICSAIFYIHYTRNGPSLWTLNFFKESLLYISLNLVALCLLIFGSLRLKHIAGILLVIFSALEARAHTRGWFPEAYPSSCYPPTAVTDFLRANADSSRVQGLGRTAIPAIISRETYGLETAVGRMAVSAGLAVLLRQADPDAYKNHPTQYLFSEATILDHTIWDLLNVRYFIARKSFLESEARRFYHDDRLKFHRLSDGTVIERASNSQPALFRNQLVVAKDEQDMSALLSGNFDWSQSVVIEPKHVERLRGLISSASTQPFEAQQLDYIRAENEIRMKVSQSQPGIWIFSERWDTLWQVSVDGVPTQPVRAFYALQGIPVSAGEHTIQLSYELPGLKLANAFTALATCLFVTIVALVCFRKDSANQPIAIDRKSERSATVQGWRNS
jgi:hypothetical protein